MRIIIGESKKALKQAIHTRDFMRETDPKEKEYLEQVEIRRQKTNLIRSMITAFFFIVVLVGSALGFIITGTMDIHTIVFMIWSAIIMIVYIVLAERYYLMPSEAFENISLRHRISLLYMSFWSLYCCLVSVSPKSYQGDIEGVTLWMAMLFVSLVIPMFSRQEVAIILPVALITALIHVRLLGVSWIGVAVCSIIVLLLLLLACVNHAERVESYYQTVRNRTEFYATKRRLGKIFEEVFDMAFEFNVPENKCMVLRSDGNYDAFSGNEMTIDKFIDELNFLVHPDDNPICEKNFNMEILANEFMLGRTQLYFEIRLKNKQDEYNWVSILITKETEMGTVVGDAYLCLVQDIEDRKRNENKLRLEAEKDPLTQLYNKVTTRSLIEEALETNPSAQHALMVIDIDNFKTINDTRGHAVGDKILLAFTSELNNNFRESDIIGRAGGDEFVVLMKNVQSVAMICDKLQRLISSFKKYGIDNGFPGRLSTSIGVALYNKDGKNYEELFRKADAALYEAKRNGKDQYKFSISKTD